MHDPMHDPTKEEILIVLNTNAHRVSSDWWWDEALQRFAIRGSGAERMPIHPLDAKQLYRYYMSQAANESPGSVYRTPFQKFNRVVALLTEASHHLMVMADPVKGIRNQAIRMCVGVVSSLVCKLRDDLRSLERQYREQSDDGK